MRNALERFVAPGTQRRDEAPLMVRRDVSFTHSAVRSKGHNERTSLEAGEGGERYRITAVVAENRYWLCQNVRKTKKCVVACNLISAFDVIFDDGPLAVCDVRVETDVIQRVCEVDLVGRVDPRL